MEEESGFGSLCRSPSGAKKVGDKENSPPNSPRSKHPTWRIPAGLGPLVSTGIPLGFHCPGRGFSGGEFAC